MASRTAPSRTRSRTRAKAEMAHRIGGRKLSRKQGPRQALFKNLTVSVLRYERVQTTEAKAKELRPFVEKLITKARNGTLHSRRLAGRRRE